MLHFENDYNCGAHPKVLERLIATNLDPQTGYGEDAYTKHAVRLIQEACDLPEAEVFFIAGGTQTNEVVISSILEPYEGVLSALTGHINAHEAGAVEYTGHKVMLVPSSEGKIIPEELENTLATFHADENRDHMVWPGMVYISYPTEYGTLYTKEELEQIHSICGRYGIKLFIDGARLGYGLASPACDLTLPELARSCDVFYIGGTKVGALCGEAVVFSCMSAPKHFLTMVKQKGAMLAKGRLCGVQFEALFSPGSTGELLYMEISRHAIRMAKELVSILREKGYLFMMETPTNQQFLFVNSEELARIKENVCYSFWEKADDEHTVIRLATSWSTTPTDLEELRKVL